MKKIIQVLLLLILVFTASCQEKINNTSTKSYTSWLPAASTDDAMLLGNGTMGALVFGYPHNETIILSVANLFLPLRIPKPPIDQISRLPEIRKLLIEGKNTEAEKIPLELCNQEGYKGTRPTDPFIPAFDLKIETSPANIIKYKRGLNFETGEAYVTWSQIDNVFERRQFISRADSIMVLHITAQNPFDASFAFDRRSVVWNQWDYINQNIKNTEFYAKESNLIYKSEFVHQWEGNIAGYEGVGKVIALNGETTTNGHSVSVRNTTDVMLLIKIETRNVGGSFETDKINALLDQFEPNYPKLLSNHIKVHSELFNRVQLHLNGNENDAKSDAEVMMMKAKANFTPAFVEKQFYAARYNILSATGKNLPNLQGIWGSSWQPPWSSDFTHDGNLPMAVSSYLCSNMPELMKSYFDYHDTRLDDYKLNAKKLFGCRGIMIPSHTSSHGLNLNYGPVWCLNFWTGGAAWAAHFYYDYWLYTNDIKFLKERAYPFMKESAQFYEDFLSVGDDGNYVFNPSYSPENNPTNSPSQAVVNATMDVMLAKELLRNVIQAGKILNESKDQLQKWEQMLAKMPAYEVDSTGALREWLLPGYQENHHHRHVSHLYGMYDIIDHDIKTDSVLWKGVHKAVEERMKIRRQDHGGIMVFGLVQLAWVAENLGDEKLTQDIISWLSAQYWSNSLATFHDPNGLFNMDLSGGFQSVIIRSLIYSEPGYISILPAKPPVWESGSISGILARNQVKINELKWSTKQVDLQLESPKKQQVLFRLPQKTESIKVENGKLINYDKKEQTATINVAANQKVKITLILMN